VVRVDRRLRRPGIYRDAVFVVRVDERAVARGHGGSGEAPQPIVAPRPFPLE
jgi:hypothetical protein